MQRLRSVNVERMRYLKGSNNKDGDTDASYSYIFNPPRPPEDIAPAGQVQARQPFYNEKSEYEPYCKHCGGKLAREQSICHVCINKVI